MVRVMNTPLLSPPVTMREAIAAEIRAQMGRRNIRQRHLADALGRHQQWLSRRLNGEVTFSIDDLEAICLVLNISVRELVVGIDPEPAVSALDRRGLGRRGVVCNDGAPFVPFSVLELAA